MFPQFFSFVFVGKLAFLSAFFSDTYSLALEIQRIASINFQVSARLGWLAQSAI
ncbi:hypothetical protein VVMO6_01317 [Vibrio vulnificus MO6-24/O]|nr:hypothetical protein VVMO6_01317 [Vibrio vulnificus MO6-24/O]